MRGTEEIQTPLYELEGFDQVVRSLLTRVPPEYLLAAYPREELEAAYMRDAAVRKLVKKLPPEQVLAAYKPKDRLAGLSPKQILPALPVEVLAGFKETYLASLPDATRAMIRGRIAEHRATARRSKARQPARGPRKPAKAARK